MFICKSKPFIDIHKYMNCRNKFFLLGFLALILVSFTSCKKREQYPIEPVISFESFTKIANNFKVDDKAILSIAFTDGDGDIGLEPWDTLPPFNYNSPYYYNIYIDYYEKRNGVFELIELPLTNNARIPFIEADLAERGIRGNIEVELYINNVLSPYDTIKFSAYIYDRALHKSNIMETPEIVVDKTP